MKNGAKLSQQDADLQAFEQAVARRMGNSAQNTYNGARVSKRRKRTLKRALIPACVVVFLVVCYLLLAFSSIPLFAYCRTIWISTAMTTGRHHWLATAFFPKSVVEEVMQDFRTNSDTAGGASHLTTGDAPAKDTPASKQPASGQNSDPLNQKNLTVGGKDYAGNTVLVNDIEEGLVISEIVGNGYRGQILLIDDPARVFLGTTLYKGETGMRILDMMDAYGAVAATNASGFNDADGNGNGGVLVGLCRSEGEDWGNYISSYDSLVLTTDNKLVVGNIGDWSNYSNIRDGIQFYPVLIADGERQIEGAGSYGLQPRTAIAQREDGVIAFLVIDGRQPTWSVGCTVGDMAEILMEYGMINAACCDGGASCCIAYGGKLTTKNCSWNPEVGRILPNAFMVRSKKDM